jgi:hypothetical protein
MVHHNLIIKGETFQIASGENAGSWFYELLITCKDCKKDTVRVGPVGPFILRKAANIAVNAECERMQNEAIQLASEMNISMAVQVEKETREELIH